MLALGIVGAVVAFRAPRCCGVPRLGVRASLIVYSWAGEKFAWLVLHPLLPLILLAGVGAAGALGVAALAAGKLALGATALALAYSVYASALVNAVHPADPREFLVSTQSSTDVADAGARSPRWPSAAAASLKVLVDSGRGRHVPVGLVLRDLDVGYLDLPPAGEPPTAAT